MSKPLSVRSRKIANLQLDPDNARKHTDVDVEAIAKSLDKFGQQSPIVITSDGTVVKGNGTMLAAMRLGWESIDAVVTTLSGDELRAYAIADNQTGLLSEWDDEKLREQLKAFEQDEELLASLGFKDLEEEVTEGEEEENPEPEVKFSEVVDESHNYVVLVFDNDLDWLSAQTHFQLESKYSRRQNGKPWSKGVGRVIDGAKYLRDLKDEG